VVPTRSASETRSSIFEKVVHGGTCLETMFTAEKCYRETSNEPILSNTVSQIATERITHYMCARFQLADRCIGAMND
jgi:hypothetical protein